MAARDPMSEYISGGYNTKTPLQTPEFIALFRESVDKIKQGIDVDASEFGRSVSTRISKVHGDFTK